ncbi:MAG: putative dienelactone hydrolase [Granulosicoccus sp.]|jgi:predicted dienelactone hydrolase
MSLIFRSKPALGLALVTQLFAGHAMAENRIDTQRPDAPELAAYGDYEVGTRPLTMINPDQLNVLALDASVEAPDPLPTYNRELEVQMWYPSYPGATGSKAVRAFLRDATTEVDLIGQATLWAAPVINSGAFPLVIISHGYPGNRFLLSHLAENLASKGYVVASIDHTDSTYRTQAAFGSTLRNRSLDQLFVLNEVARLNNDSASFLNGLVDTENTAIIGYSMGAYGAVITAGGGVTEASVAYPFSPPYGTLGIHQSGSDTHNTLPDPRVKTAIAIAPWGRNLSFFDAESLKGVQIPLLYVAGSEDSTSLYEGGVLTMWEESVNVDRGLLTFENANHNAAAPMPAPAESYAPNATLGFAPFGHYADPVWDTVRMNNILQHFATAWMDGHLKSDSASEAYFDLTPDSNEGVYSTDDDGNFTDNHTYWKGFANQTAKGLHFDWLEAGETVDAGER